MTLPSSWAAATIASHSSSLTPAGAGVAPSPLVAVVASLEAVVASVATGASVAAVVSSAAAAAVVSGDASPALPSSSSPHAATANDRAASTAMPRVRAVIVMSGFPLRFERRASKTLTALSNHHEINGIGVRMSTVTTYFS